MIMDMCIFIIDIINCITIRLLLIIILI